MEVTHNSLEQHLIQHFEGFAKADRHTVETMLLIDCFPPRSWRLRLIDLLSTYFHTCQKE